MTLSTKDCNVTNGCCGNDLVLSATTQRFPSQKIVVLEVDVTDDMAVHEAVEKATATVGPIIHVFCFSGIVGVSAQWT